MRTLLILIIGALLARMVMRLARTLRSALPDEDDKPEAPVSKGKIIDAEFEDLDRDG